MTATWPWYADADTRRRPQDRSIYRAIRPNDRDSLVLREQAAGKEMRLVHPKLMALLTREGNKFERYR